MNITKKVTKAFVAVFVMISMFPMMNLVINAEDNAQTRGAAGGSLPTVAKVGEDEYHSLMAAFAAAKGKTVVLVKDFEVTSDDERIKLTTAGEWTLDLNGYKLSQINYAGNDKQGYSKTPGTILLENASLTVKDSVGTGIIEGIQTPICVYTNSKFTLESGNLRGNWYGLTGHGQKHNTIINIKGGSIKSESEDGSGIYHPQAGMLSITGGTIEGATGVQLCSGIANMADRADGVKLSISNATIKGTGADLRADKTGDGLIPDGAAVSIVNRNYPGGIPSITINSGTFISTRQKDAVIAYTWENNTAKVWENAKDKVIIKGGKYSSSPEKYVSKGFKVYNNLLNQFVVAPVATGVTLSSSTLRLEKNNTAQLTAILAPVGAIESVGWTTSNKDVATVEPTGEVTAHGAGTATITATVEGKTASCTVSVYEIKAPVIPPVDKDTNVSLGEEAKEVLKDVVKDVIDNVKTSTAISNETREKLETALAAGKEISVAPKVEVKKESAIEKEVVTKIENAMKATTEKDKVAEIAQYYDLSMMLTAAGEPLGTVNELTGKVEFTVSIPKDLTKAGRKFYMVRVHGNGDTERIEGKLDGTDFSFETDKFSIFALVYEDNKVETPTTPTKPTTPAKPGVDTGDVTNAGMLMTMLLAAGFVGFTTLKRRNRI